MEAPEASIPSPPPAGSESLPDGEEMTSVPVIEISLGTDPPQPDPEMGFSPSKEVM